MLEKKGEGLYKEDGGGGRADSWVRVRAGQSGKLKIRGRVTECLLHVFFFYKKNLLLEADNVSSLGESFKPSHFRSSAGPIFSPFSSPGSEISRTACDVSVTNTREISMRVHLKCSIWSIRTQTTQTFNGEINTTVTFRSLSIGLCGWGRQEWRRLTVKPQIRLDLKWNCCLRLVLRFCLCSSRVQFGKTHL